MLVSLFPKYSETLNPRLLLGWSHKLTQPAKETEGSTLEYLVQNLCGMT